MSASSTTSGGNDGGTSGNRGGGPDSSGGDQGGYQSGQGDPTVPVEVRLADERRARTLDAAPVDVLLTTERRADVLAVPVTALLALAEGGYAVETAGGALLAVKPGLHAGGFVEVSGDGVHAGLLIVVPA